jgi:lipopolysaccharide transport system ATP-binding protein
MGDGGKPTTIFEHGESMRIRMRYETRRPLDRPNFIVVFVRSDGVACCNFSSALDSSGPEWLDGSGVVELVTPPLKLVAEMYSIHILVRERGFEQVVCGQVGSTFHVRHGVLDTHFGVFHESGHWSFGGEMLGATGGEVPEKCAQ